jgi:hypothetical protein
MGEVREMDESRSIVAYSSNNSNQAILLVPAGS